MKNKIISKRYYRIIFKNVSALSLGNGNNNNSDKDLMVNSFGEPYIPATSLAGVYRSLLSDNVADKYFGYIKKVNEDNHEAEMSDSQLLVYDAELYEGNPVVTIRDGVKLDEFKTAIDGSKYDYEILEPGCSFITYVEQNKFSDSENIFDAIINYMRNGNFLVGAKTSRGMGSIEIIDVKVKEFEMTRESLEKWLDFDMFNDNHWNDGLTEISDASLDDNYLSISINLKQDSMLSIKEYRTDISGKTESMPDQQQMTYRNGKAVISGTSWNGMFLHALRKYGCNDTDNLFGNTETKSKIYFSESIVENAKFKIVSRNSIDRFSGGTKDKALFTEKSCYGGNTVLTIRLPEYTGKYVKEYDGLCMALADLSEGILALGGETSIGHGIFKVESISINDKEICGKGLNGSAIYNALHCELFKEAQ